MRTLAVYNLKGGVGKTAAAVNLAWLAAGAGFRTLLWDMDPQGAASYYLRVEASLPGGIERLLEKKKHLRAGIRASNYELLDVLPADFSNRAIDAELAATRQREHRLGRLLGALSDDYDLVFLDCAPSIALATEGVFHAADALVMPVIPTQLSVRAYEQVSRFIREETDAGCALWPFFSMVDRRRSLHRRLVVDFAAAHPEVLRTFIPYASEVERMGDHRAPLHDFARASGPAQAFEGLWQAIAARLADTRGP